VGPVARRFRPLLRRPAPPLLLFSCRSGEGNATAAIASVAGRPVVVVEHSGPGRRAWFFQTSRTRTFFATLVFLARSRQASAVPCYITLPHNCCTFRCSRRVEPPLRTSIPFVIFCVHCKIILLLFTYTQNRPNGVRSAYTQYSFYNIICCTRTNNTRRKTIF